MDTQYKNKSYDTFEGKYFVLYNRKMYQCCILIQYIIHRILTILTYIIDIMIIIK
jgi:hypothetical protein